MLRSAHVGKDAAAARLFLRLSDGYCCPGCKQGSEAHSECCSCLHVKPPWTWFLFRRTPSRSCKRQDRPSATCRAGSLPSQHLSSCERVVQGACRVVADRKSTRLNSSHPSISYAVFCLKKKTNK